MKHSIFYTLLLCLALPTATNAQQEHMQTQFMFNKLTYNPAYAGSYASPVVTVVNRHQWIGIEGAPNTQAVSYCQPTLNKHFGIALNLVRNEITINRNLNAELSYAYQLPLPRGYLGIGIQASMRHFRQNWNDDRLVTSQPIDLDVAVPTGMQGKIVPNFGTGLFYTAPRWYAGASIPRLVDNNIDLSEEGTITSREIWHLNVMAGSAFPLSSTIDLVPQFLFRYVKNAPPDLDVNLTLDVRRRFLGGVTYRMGGDSKDFGESIDIMAGAFATKNLMFMLSYDIGLTRLASIRNGSVEATFRWIINPPQGTGSIDPNRPDREVMGGKGTYYYF